MGHGQGKGFEMTNETKEKIKNAINELSKDADIVALVKSIENEPIATTKGHYGRYMSVLGQWGNDSRVMLDIVAQALINAGANRFGVLSAKGLITGEAY